MTTAPSIDAQTAQLLTHLRRGGTYSYFWAASQTKNGHEAAWKRTFWLNGTGPDRVPGTRHPEYGPVNLYFGVHPLQQIPQVRTDDRGNTYQPRPETVRAQADEVCAINCLYAELDVKKFGSKAAIIEHLDTLPAVPSVIIDSGGGDHVYWLLAEPFILDTPEAWARAESIQRRWSALVGSDEAKDLNRVLRVPGTKNFKYNPPRDVVFVRADFDRLYDLQTLEDELPPDTAPPPQAGTNGTAFDDDEIDAAAIARAQLALNRLSAERCDNYGTWIAVGQALIELGYAGLQLWIAWSRKSEKYQQGVCEAKWQTFRRDPNGRTLASLFHWANEDDPPPPAAPETTPPPPAAEAGPATGAPASPFHCTDLGNAQRLAYLHGRNARFVPRWRRWYVWDGTRWAEDELNHIRYLARDIPKAIYREAVAASDNTRRETLGKWAVVSESRDKLTAAVSLFESEPGIPVRHGDLDQDVWALNCLNGTIDLRTGILRDHRRGDLITKRVEIAYDPVATCPRWLAFLDRIFAQDADLIAFIQRAVGYTLTGDISEQCLFFEYGTGKNGKSTFSAVLQLLLGDYGQQAPSELILMKNADNVPTDVARLRGARLALTSEIEHGRRLAESKVKDLTGGDRIVARFMRQDFFEFAPTHKLWIYGNHKPVIRGSDEGIWRRIRLIPFTVTIPPEERDPIFITCLMPELPGILAWAARGCLDWQRYGLHEPQCVIDATAEYREEMDILGPFLAECCVIGNKRLHVTAKDLYAAYKLWCVDNGEEAVAQQRLGRMLNERGFVQGQRDTAGARTWRGIALKP